jgi:hypothetical protein
VSDVHLSKISLESAPGPKETATEAHYDFFAPLDAQGHIDLSAWKHARALCFVHRKDKDGTVQHGLLMHRPGGVGGSTWVFDYELGQGDEESGFRFESHAFVVGAYVAIRDAEGQSHTYRVAEVKPA